MSPNPSSAIDPALGRLDQLLTLAARDHGGKTAIVKRSERMTYAELEQATQRMANLLRSRGVKQGDRVALSALNGTEFVISYCAILRLGAVVVPLNVLIGARLLAERLNDCGAVLLICVTGPDGLPSAEVARAGCERASTCREAIIIDPESAPIGRLLAGQPDTIDAVQVAPSDPAVIAYPQRAPGVVDGVVLSHAAMLHGAAAIEPVLYPGSAADVQLVALPLFHLVAQTLQLNIGIARGAKLVMKPRFDPEVALQLIDSERISSFVATPSMLWALAEAARKEPEGARAAAQWLQVLSSQLAPLPAAVATAVERELGVLPVEGFGLSETAMVALHARPGDRRPGSVGVPLDGYEMRLVGNDGAPVVGAGRGRMQLRGPSLMDGYYRKPEATAAAMDGDWFQTGYMAERQEDGHCVMVDRPTHIVMRRGIAVYHRAVEEALLAHPAIMSAKVVAQPDARTSEELQTLIERDPRAVISENELLQWAYEQLPGLAGTDVQLATGAAKAGAKGGLALAPLLPGFAYAAAGTALAFLIHRLLPVLSPLTAGVLLGVILANVGLVGPRIMPGLSLSTKKLLRIGVVFLGSIEFRVGHRA